MLKTVLGYMRSDRKFLPSDISIDLKNQIELELRYWNVTTLDYDLATSENLIKMEEMLKSRPVMFEGCSKKSLENWDQLGPISI